MAASGKFKRSRAIDFEVAERLTRHFPFIVTMTLNPKNHLIFVLFVGLHVFAPLMHAQSTAQISGRATDATGSVVPKVKVAIVDDATGVVVRNTVTNSDGIYTVPALAIGRYTVRAEDPGFQTYERTGIVLNVNSTVEINIALVVGTQAQSVSVQADQIQVQSQTSDLSTVIDSKQISEIDTNGRSIFQLTELVPGASSQLPNFNNPVAENTTTTISFNGERSAHNLYLLDGGEINDRGCGGCYDVTPSQNAISEFKVISGNAAADIGMASGGFIALAMKGGTNTFHGQAWEYNRNDALDANDFFANESGTAKPELRYNIFGFNIGGPVVIPRVYSKKQSKTFFFYNMEWRRLVQGTEIYANAIPTPAFSGNFGSSTITVPQTSDPVAIAKFAAFGLKPGEQFPNNQIPAGLIDPNVNLLLKAGIFPQPNTPDGAHFSAAPPAISNLREEAGRVDHYFNDKVALMASFLYDSGTLTSIPPGYGATYPTDGSITDTPSYAVEVNLTDTFSPHLLNVAAFNYTGNQIKVLPTGIYQLPAGYNASPYFAGVNADNRIPDIILGQPYGVEYTVGSNPWYNLFNSWEYKDDLTWVHGKHTVTAGGSFLLAHKYQKFFGSTQGTYNFSGTFTGNSFADLLLGYAGNYSQLQSQDFLDTASHTLGFYALDSWKVSSRLTLNLGVRWEFLPHTFDKNNHLSNFNAATYNPAEAPMFNPDGSLDQNGPGFSVPPVGAAIPTYLNGIALAGRNGTPKSLVATDYNNFAPRVGFAYDVTGDNKTILRSGFGMFYERVAGNDTYDLGPNPPFSNTPSANNVYFSNPATSNVTGLTATTPVFPSGLSSLNPYYPVPTSMQYSFGVQRQLSSASVLSAAYAGDATYHQSSNRDINTVPLNDPNRLAICGGNCGYTGPTYNANVDRNFPGFASIIDGENIGTSRYNSLQASWLVRARKDLTFSAAYTWSHSIDTGSEDGFTLSDPYSLAYDRGNSDFDRRHTAKFSYFYSFPFFRDSKNAFVKTALGGWQISGITTAETGLPFSASLGYDNTGLGGSESSRADVIGPVKYLKTAAHWFDPSSFVAPPPLTFGNSARNLIYGPGLFNWDIALYKSFPLWREGARFEFRGETFNTFNHTEFNSVDNNFSNGPTQFGQVTSVYQPRLIQLGASISF